MFDKKFVLDERTLPILEQIGGHMPGGFFIYRNNENGDLLYVNKNILDLYACKTLDEFKELTGFTFKGMVHPDDYEESFKSINNQIFNNDSDLDYVEYRIIRKDKEVRWVDDYGHYMETSTYGGIYYVFISDITDKKMELESDMVLKQTVVDSVTKSYEMIWLIKDIEQGDFYLYKNNYGDIDCPFSEITNFNEAVNCFIKHKVSLLDQERIKKELNLEKIIEVLREKRTYSINYLQKNSDGLEDYFRLEFSLVNLPNKKVGLVCAFKNIDEEVRAKKEIDEALRKNKEIEEENLRLIQEAEAAKSVTDMVGAIASLSMNLPAMTFSKDAETGVYLACNQSFADYAHKKDPSGVIGLTDLDIFDKETALHFISDDKTAVSMDNPHVFIEDVPDAIGNLMHFQTTKMKFLDARGKVCVLGMCVDVTEITKKKIEEAKAKAKQQELEEKLALTEKLYQEENQRIEQKKMITALASDYFSVYYIELDTLQGVCYQKHPLIKNALEVGEQFNYLEKMIDYAHKYISELYQEEFIKFIQPDSIREGLKEQRVISYRYLVNRNNKETYEMINFAGVRHPEDRDDHFVHSVGACFRDIDSETRKDLEQNQILSDALIVAEEASKAKTTFLSNMSHEIRTPMNAIIGLNNIALNDKETSEKTKEYLRKIDSSAEHLLHLINDILDMSRIESGKMVLKNEEFSFSKMLDDINVMFSGQCHEKEIEYLCHISGQIDDYYIGDNMKLKQILINILSNAVKFTDKNGKIHFVVEKIAEFEDKSTIKFVISDTGRGMSKEFLPHIFNAFSQEDSSYSSKYGSSGLGLAITKNIVEMMNGNIEVESEKNKGSTFFVTITLLNSKKHHNNKTHEFKAEDLNVLVVDDDEVALKHAKLVLENVGIVSNIAKSGKEALEMILLAEARGLPYNLILVDWKMPEMDGIETTKKIREMSKNDVAIIILTAYRFDDILQTALDAGVDNFVSKPLFAENVISEFEDALKNKRNGDTCKGVDLTNKRILLAEDVEINAEIMTMILENKNMIVEHAENGKIALDKFKDSEIWHYDAILMDVRMPVMDGLEATRRIRSLDRDDAKRIPIIALTANAFDEDVQRSLQAGLNAHLSKPVQVDALLKTLENLIASNHK